MNIKKRLFVSNILMLIIPIILSIIITTIMYFVITGVIRINSSFNYDSASFGRVVEDTDKTFTAWSKYSNFQIIKMDIYNFNSKNKSKNISLSLYEKNHIIYPISSVVAIQNKKFIGTILDGAISHTGVLDNNAFYSKKINNYTVVLTCSNYIDINSNFKRYKSTIKIFIILLFFVVISIIFFTNYFLTKFILKRIVDPLEILNYGVHQIQLGNLNYHIEYYLQDEFSIVCTDFNLMAQRLRNSVGTREKDELSRKELIAGISHDLRTPLTSIKAYVEGLIDGIATTPEIQKSYLETIKTKAEDIDHIVDKLFMFSKLDMGEFPFYLEKLNVIEELVSFIRATSEEYKNNGLILKLTQNIKDIYINIDPVQFRNVLTNIVENSVKYKNKECGLLEIACFDQGVDVCITLTDDGPGVPKKSLDKIFNIFFRNDPSRNNSSKGSGLGLAITAKIIERLNGHIWAENAQNGGLRTVITIPKCE